MKRASERSRLPSNEPVLAVLGLAEGKSRQPKPIALWFDRVGAADRGTSIRETPGAVNRRGQRAWLLGWPASYTPAGGPPRPEMTRP
jgi:hypothetical protein